MVVDAASRPANQFVTYIDNTGTQNTAALAIADLPTGTVTSATPVVGSSDIVTCSTANAVYAPFATTITRPAFTVSGGEYLITFDAYLTSSVTGVQVSWEVKDGSTVVYSMASGQTIGIANLQSGLMFSESAYGTLSSATLNTYAVGGSFNAVNGTQQNNAAQPTGFGANSSGTITLLVKCSTNTAGNQAQLLGIHITKVN